MIKDDIKNEIILLFFFFLTLFICVFSLKFVNPLQENPEQAKSYKNERYVLRSFLF